MKALCKFALFLSWWWIRWTPIIAFAFAFGMGNEAEAVAIQSDCERLHELEQEVEAHYGESDNG